MLHVLLLLTLAQAFDDDDLPAAPPALSLLPAGAGAKSGLLITGSGECSVNGVAGSYGEAVTFTRATAWSCTRSDGSMVWLDAGVPALVGGSVKVRPQTINAAIQDATLDVAATWVPLGTFGAGATADAGMNPVVTANSADVLDPLGGNSAEKIVFAATNVAGDSSALQQSITGTAAAWSAGIYLRTLSGTATLYLYDYTGSSAPPANALATCAVTSTWSRCKWENATLSVAAYKLSLGVDLRATIGTGQSAKATSTIYAWGAQAQTGAALDDFCGPTLATAVTCNAETVAMSNPLAGVNPSAWCIEGRAASGSETWTQVGARIGGIGNIGSAYNVANAAALYITTGGAVEFRVNNAANLNRTITTSAGLSAGVHVVKGCVAPGASPMSIWVDGVAVAFGVTNPAGDAVLATQPASVYVGSLGTAYQFGAGISDFAITNLTTPLPGCTLDGGC